MALQTRADIDLHCEEDREHTDSCHVDGFHDIKRAFATNEWNWQTRGIQKLTVPVRLDQWNLVFFKANRSFEAPHEAPKTSGKR